LSDEAGSNRQAGGRHRNGRQVKGAGGAVYNGRNGSRQRRNGASGRQAQNGGSAGRTACGRPTSRQGEVKKPRAGMFIRRLYP